MFKSHTVLIVTLALFFFSGCKRQLSDSERIELQRSPGNEWLSWTPQERDIYLRGFLSGYGHGASVACVAADSLFEQGVPHVIGHDNVPSTFPSRRLCATVPVYPRVNVSLSTGVDVSPYTTVITDFYSKHPDRQDLLPLQLMDMMAGKNVPSADDLYRRFQ